MMTDEERGLADARFRSLLAERAEQEPSTEEVHRIAAWLTSMRLRIARDRARARSYTPPAPTHTPGAPLPASNARPGSGEPSQRVLTVNAEHPEREPGAGAP